jgi:hypothetical protein
MIFCVRSVLQMTVISRSDVGHGLGYSITCLAFQGIALMVPKKQSPCNSYQEHVSSTKNGKFNDIGTRVYVETQNGSFRHNFVTKKGNPNFFFRQK